MNLAVVNEAVTGMNGVEHEFTEEEKNFTVMGNINSVVWRLYFYIQGRKCRCIGRNFFNWFPAVL